MAGCEAPDTVRESVHWQPAAALRSLIAWYSGYREAGLEPARHRGLPSPYLTLIVTLDDPLTVSEHPDPRQGSGQYVSLVGGLHTTPALITHEGRQSGIQLALSPLGARALLGLPAGELANIDLHAAEVLGPLAAEMHERLREAATWSERFAILDRLLLRQIDLDRAPPAQLVRAWCRLQASGGGAGVEELSRQVGWSSRHLREQFRAEIGLSPKAAARVIRFDRARRLLQTRAAAGGGPGLADLAATCGYYDQAHLARDFRELAGSPPSRWLADEFRNVQDADWDPLAELAV